MTSDFVRRVSGQKDPVIALLRELTVEDGRRRAGRFFAEGEEIVRRAFDYGGAVDSLILTERFVSTPAGEDLARSAEEHGAALYSATEGLLAKVLGAKPTPECIAIVERRVVSLAQALGVQNPLVQMVEQGENADNLGMLLRTTDAAGVSSVILAAGTTDPFSRRVVRGSRGAVFTVPICIEHDPLKPIAEARKAGLQTIASSANASLTYTDLDYTKPTMLIVGNEHTGISDGVRQAADAVVRIPMLGRINSLNIAVAASILMYEAIRQRAGAPRH